MLRIDGCLTVELPVELRAGERLATDGAGGTVFLRHGVPHCYQNFSDRDARLLIAVAPAAFEGVFHGLSASTPADGGLPPLAVLDDIHARYGITTLGPPMLP